MGLSRLEVNFRRLLAKCELMIKNKQKDDERFPKYLNSLDEMLQQLEGEIDVTLENNINDYIKRIKNLKAAYDGKLLNMLDNKVEKELVEENIDEIADSRSELLGIRKRQANNTQDLDELIHHHQNMQEKIAENMLILTRNLKEQSELANKIIRKDIEVVGKSAQISDQNFSKLKVESEKLQEHSKRAWKCWMWIMIAIVMVVFINMVLFMKIAKKST